MAWAKVKIVRDDGTWADAQAPVIVSASRSTDIPAFYADWFFYRLQRGYSAWTNPFNGKKSFVSYQHTRFIVFWSKHPAPLLPFLTILKEKQINCYIQYTLNDYEKEGLEKGVPSVEKRIDTFKRLVDELGFGHVVWRFDPLMLTDQIDIPSLMEKVASIGDRLKGYTEKLVFSFADISSYRKVKMNLDRNHILYREWTEEEMDTCARYLAELNRNWNYQLATCCEQIELAKYGILHNRCIDDDLIIRLAYRDTELMKFLGVEIRKMQPSLFEEEQVPEDAIHLNGNLYAVKTKNNKDKGQRVFCGCINSKDIGEYNTCPHSCEYCYANMTKERAVSNYRHYLQYKQDEMITGG